MMLGLLVMAIGALIFIPAAKTRTYGLFLTGLFVIGTGLSILQTASNPYITILGPIESAAKRISIMGICNKVAGFLAPLILGAIILADADTLVKELQGLDSAARLIRLDEIASRVVNPYIIIAVVLTVLALMVRLSPLPEVEMEQNGNGNSYPTEDRKSIFMYPNIVLGVIAIFFCVGVEVVAGDTLPMYGQSQGIALSEARSFTSYTLAAMVIGYIIGIISIPKFISQSRALALSAGAGIIFSIIAIFTKGYTSVLFIALLGLANALMWPAIWPLAIHGLGKYTKIGSAMLIMGISGGALLPLLWGRLSMIHAIGHQHAYWIMVPCYLFILYYSLNGHRIKSWVKS
jgi:FHS family L-fucose permease-like MFS transporter